MCVTVCIMFYYLDIYLNNADSTKVLAKLVFSSVWIHALNEYGVFLGDHVASAAVTAAPVAAVSAAAYEHNQFTSVAQPHHVAFKNYLYTKFTLDFEILLLITNDVTFCA